MPDKTKLWNDFVQANNVEREAVPLFNTVGNIVSQLRYGVNARAVLQRSEAAEQLMRGLGRQLICEYRDGRIEHDGILYMMLHRGGSGLVPLYIGKAETFGKGDRNLSANISDLATGNGNFGRWGYNYAYHLGDLSAVTLPGHPPEKQTIKYKSWRDTLFDVDGDTVSLKAETLFWACLWGPMRQSVWAEYGSTKLAFEEYLLIGVASDVFPESLLNREGRTR